MAAASTVKNLAVAIVAGVAAMLIYDTIKKRAAMPSQPVGGVPSRPVQSFTGGIISYAPGSATDQPVIYNL